MDGTELGLPLGTDGRVPDLSVVAARAELSPSAPLPAPEHVGLVVAVVSPSSRKTDRFAEPGSGPGRAPRCSGASGPAPWGTVPVDLASVRRLSS